MYTCSSWLIRRSPCKIRKILVRHLPRGPTPTKIVSEIPSPVVILARFQIPDQDSGFVLVQDGYVIKRAQKGRCEEIEGVDIRKFPDFTRTRLQIPRQFHLRFQAKCTRFQLVLDPSTLD